MPSKSAKQRRFMQIAAHNPDFARKAGIAVSVAREFVRADQGILSKRRKRRKKGVLSS